MAGYAWRLARTILHEFDDPRDWHRYGGLALIVGGVWMMSPAYALIVTGTGLLLLDMRASSSSGG